MCAALLVAGFSEKVDKNISAMLETDFQKGIVTMICRESSSGTRYALFTFKDDFDVFATSLYRIVRQDAKPPRAIASGRAAG